MFDLKYARVVHTHTHVAVKTHSSRSFRHYCGKLVMEGESTWGAILLYCMCVSSAELRGTMTGKRLAGGEWGVSTQRVCIQTLINSVLPSSLPGIPAFLGHMPVTWMVCISLCVWKHHNMSPAFVFVLSPTLTWHACPPMSDFVKRPEATEWIIITLCSAWTLVPQTRVFIDCIHKQTTTRSPSSSCSSLCATHSLWVLSFLY